MDENEESEFGENGLKKERSSGPERSYFFIMVKKLTIAAICFSTLTANVALLGDLLDYLNEVNLQSLASGIVTGLSLITIIFKLIGLFSVIKEDFKYTLSFAILLVIGTGSGLLILVIFFPEHILKDQLGIVLVSVIISNCVTTVLTTFFAFLIKWSDPKQGLGSSRVSPAGSEPSVMA